MRPEDYMPQIQAEDCRGLAAAFRQKDGSKCCNAASLRTGVNRRASVPVSHALHLAVVLVSCALHWAVPLVSLSCCRASQRNSVPCFPMGCMHGVPLRIPSHGIGVP